MLKSLNTCIMFVVFPSDTDQVGLTPTQDFQLSFHKNNDDDDEDEDLGDEDEDYEDHYPSDWETEVDHEGKTIPMNTSSIPFFINMGTVPTTNIHPGASNGTGRMLSFPNWLQVFI